MTDRQQQESSPALIHLHETAVKLQSKKWDSIRVLPDAQVPARLKNSKNVRHVNSIVFTLSDNNSSFVLAVLDQDDRVDVALLEQAVVASTNMHPSASISLAPAETLAQICGFDSGTVPPLGLTPAPLLTLVERSLVLLLDADDADDENTFLLVGGGGTTGQKVLLPLRTLLDAVPDVQVADFRVGKNALVQPVANKQQQIPSRSQSMLSAHEQVVRPNKPFFAIAPPDRALAECTVREESLDEDKALLQPELVTLVGRISGLRQMARRLVFVDLAPPSYSPFYEDGGADDEDQHPWRSPTNRSQDMAVQLILGKTICQNLGDQDGELALRRLKIGQMILVQGRTNVNNQDSLKNWITKDSLDIVVFDYQLMSLQPEKITWSPKAALSKGALKTSQGMSPQSTNVLQKLPYLTLEDMYPNTSLSLVDDETVQVVDTLESVEMFHDNLAEWLTDTNADDQPGLVGLDCEWKPKCWGNSNKNEPQPVLLMQVCVHPLQRIYLLDLQTLVRPLLQPAEQKNAVELSVSKAMRLLLSCPRLIKVGFQVSNDFQRLAASYPHISEFQQVSSVLEVSRLGIKVMQMSKQPGAREATASLSKMVETFVHRALNKGQQVSDWSVRPLSTAQVEYGALDALVTPYIAERLVESVGASFSATPTIQIGRWDNDVAFGPFLTNWRFLLLDSTHQSRAIRKWKGKRLVGDALYIVSQSWLVHENAPSRPSIPEDGDGPYSDLNGIVRVPSKSIKLVGTVIEGMIGEWTAKSKDACLMALLKGSNQMKEDWKLEFPQRSGYVVLENAVALFVTLPERDGSGRPRSYPNEWLEDGAILSWFVKEKEWAGGTSRLAEKLTNAEDIVVLFVRRGKGLFLCCGHCRVETLEKEETRSSEQWSNIKLFLMLTDWVKLQAITTFQELVNPGRHTRSDH